MSDVVDLTRESSPAAGRDVVDLTRESSEDEAAQPAAAAADRAGAVDDASDVTPKAKRTLSASADYARDDQTDTPREKQARLEGVAAALARTEHAATHWSCKGVRPVTGRLRFAARGARNVSGQRLPRRPNTKLE
jgi:hypothetical protein